MNGSEIRGENGKGIGDLREKGVDKGVEQGYVGGAEFGGDIGRRRKALQDMARAWRQQRYDRELLRPSLKILSSPLDSVAVQSQAPYFSPYLSHQRLRQRSSAGVLTTWIGIATWDLDPWDGDLGVRIGSEDWE